MKRMVCLLLALLWCAGAARASVAVNGSLSALVGEDGQTAIAPGAYARIIPVNAPALFAAADAKGKLALFDENGAALTEALYTDVEFSGGALLYACGEKYGVMDANLNAVVPCEFTWIVPNGEGGYLALRTDIYDDSPDGVYYIDETGYISPTGVKVASFLMMFSEGLSPALSTENGRYGYLNPQGQWAIRPQYAYADGFQNGAAVAAMDSGSGVIDTGGGWKLTPKYDFVSLGAGEGALTVGVNYRQGVSVFDSACRLLYTLPMKTYGAYVSAGGGRVYAYGNDGVYVLDETGEAVFTLGADALVVYACEGRMIVCDGQWGEACTYVADEDGARLSGSYQDLSFLARTETTSYYVFAAFDTDKAGDTLYWGDEGVYCGLMDETGREILPAKYNQMDSPAENRVFCEDDEGMYLYDLAGNLLWEYRF